MRGGLPFPFGHPAPGNSARSPELERGGGQWFQCYYCHDSHSHQHILLMNVHMSMRGAYPSATRRLGTVHVPQSLSEGFVSMISVIIATILNHTSILLSNQMIMILMNYELQYEAYPSATRRLGTVHVPQSLSDDAVTAPPNPRSRALALSSPSW